MSTKPQHLPTGEQIARALSQLGEDVTAERVRADETYRRTLFRDSPDVAADVQYIELPEFERRAVDHRRERVRQLKSLLDECAADPVLAEVCRPELERIAEAVFGPKRLTHAHINEAVYEAGIRPTFQQSWKLCELLDQKPLYYRPDLLEKHREVPQETAPSTSL